MAAILIILIKVVQKLSNNVQFDIMEIIKLWIKIIHEYQNNYNDWYFEFWLTHSRFSVISAVYLITDYDRDYT